MKIAVNTRFLLDDYLEGYGYFLYETLRRMVADHPEHEFIFIFDRPYNRRFVFADNVKAVVTGPPARHPILWKLWYDIKVPVILRKHKADVFVSCDGFCSLSTKVPQCMVLHDLSFLHYPAFIKKSHLIFHKRYTPKFLAKARSIATVSLFSRNDILAQYRVNKDKIQVVYSAAKEIFQPVSRDVKERIKEKYTDGKEYFLYTGAIHPRKNLMNLLKAFSVFKKKQKSNLKLVLAGRLAWKFDSFVDALKTYKYRDDVLLTGYLPEEELVKLTASAYAMVYTSLWEGFGVPVLEAMRCEVPVITSSNSAMQEITKEAALYANPDNYHSIADQMLLLYKDESVRADLIEKGKRAELEYTWARTAGLLWQSILKAVS